MAYKPSNKTLDSITAGETNFTLALMLPGRELNWSMSDPALYFPFEFIYKETDSDFDSSIYQLLAPLSPIVWFSITAFVLLTIVIILITKKLTRKQRHFIIGGKRNRAPILAMWAIVFGLAVVNRRISKRKFFGTFARTLALFWIILWLIIRNAYQGALYSSLRGHHFTSPFDTVEKVNASDCKIITPLVGYVAVKHLFSHDRCYCNVFMFV